MMIQHQQSHLSIASDECQEMIVDEGPRLSNFIGQQGLTHQEQIKGKKSAQISPNLRKKVLPPLHAGGNSMDMHKFNTQKPFKSQNKVEIKSSRK